MSQPVLLKYVLPFIIWYALMILSAKAIDYLLHLWQLPGAGLFFGYLGTILIALSFAYSVRKRIYRASGSPRRFLLFHEYIAWAGSVMILVHAGIHYHAHLPRLALIMMLINVASGLVGKFLLKNSREAFTENRNTLLERGMSEAEVDKLVFFDAVAVSVMNQWRSIHLPITLMFAILSILHILTIFMFGK